MTLLIEDSFSDELCERTACDTLALCRNTVRKTRQNYFFCGPKLPVNASRRHSVQPKALSESERQAVLIILNSQEYCNQPPVEVYFDLLQKGEYYCSISTMHRILRANQQQGERREQRPAQSHAIPRLKAMAPNQVWTWDITKLPTQKRGEYLSLYVVMDLYSRYIVAWMLSHKENSALASQLMQEATQRYEIGSNTLTLHQDRGAPMTAHCYLDVLGELAVTASHSRPRVSNDNPMSEAQFKTMKYQPDYPRRFDNYDHALNWCENYVNWYNYTHYHSGLEGFTPHQVFSGDVQKIAKTRQAALDKAFYTNPNRFSQGCPIVKLPPKEVSINPVPEDADEQTLVSGVNFSTLPKAKAKRNAI
jgi:putative transposase